MLEYHVPTWVLKVKTINMFFYAEKLMVGLHEGDAAAVSGTAVCAAQMGVNFGQFSDTHGVAGSTRSPRAVTRLRYSYEPTLHALFFQATQAR